MKLNGRKFVTKQEKDKRREAVLGVTKFTKEQEYEIEKVTKPWNLSTTVKRASEELLELALTLHHLERGKSTFNDVLSEMADVKIALRHLEFVFGNYQKQLNEKIKKVKK